MLILSVGLPKSGSAWFFHLTNDLAKAAGHCDANEVKNQFSLERFLKFTTCNVQELTPEKLRLLTSPPIGNHSFTVKTHFPPNPVLLDYLARGLVKATYIYRDPRDIAVSGYEAGQKLREEGKEKSFAKLTTMREAILWTGNLLESSWKQWRKVKGVFFVRYEDLLEHPDSELKRLCEFLGFNVTIDMLELIIDRWSAARIKRDSPQMLHFNQGVAGRFRAVMGSEELQLTRENLGTYLEEMGYAG